MKSVSVLLIVYAPTTIEHETGKEWAEETVDSVGSMIVTPKDIDLYVSDCADIISSAIQNAFLR